MLKEQGYAPIREDKETISNLITRGIIQRIAESQNHVSKEIDTLFRLPQKSRKENKKRERVGLTLQTVWKCSHSRRSYRVS